MNPILTVSIVTWNAKEEVERCLFSLEAFPAKQPMEIIVVDNASTDGTKGLIQSRFPSVILIQNDVNRGYGAAHNQAFQRSKGRYFLALNNDIVATEGALEGMIDYMEKHPEVGLLGGSLRNPDGSFQPSANRRFPNLSDLFLDEVLFFSKIRYALYRKRWAARWLEGRGSGNDGKEVSWVGGACMLIRQNAAQTVGLFDERFFFYREDCDLCLRLKKAGWKVAYRPDAVFVHGWGASSRKNSETVSMESRKSLLYYYAKHYGPSGFRMAKGTLLGGLLLRCALLFISGLFDSRSTERLRHFRKMLALFGNMENPFRGNHA